jgi:hypothetical protein
MKKKIFLSLLLFLLLLPFEFFLLTKSVLAGTNLSVSCPDTGTCSISPAATPLFDESGWMPGDSISQYIRVSNISSEDGYVAVEVINYSQSAGARLVPADFDFGDSIDIEIYKDAPFVVENLIYGTVSLTQFRNDGYFTIDEQNDGETRDYYIVALMRTDAGNDYQGGEVIFDLRVGLELEAIPLGDPTPTPTPTGCIDEKPDSAPGNFRVVSRGTNIITLAWDAVSPVTHYALVFTRDSDGASYGANNIGNVTEYQITNLGGGVSYTFQVMGINGCMPGDRSTLNSGTISGGPTTGRPIGSGGQVLGVSTEEEKELTPTPDSDSEEDSESTGKVAGTSNVCHTWAEYIPWILLIMQLIFILVSEYYFKKDEKYTKHYIAAAVTLASIAIFYLVRECDCYTNSILSWLCKWYWLVSLTLTALVKLFSYAFIEEVEDKVIVKKEEKKKKT